MDIVTNVFNAITKEELAEEEEMFLKRCSKCISLRMLNFGLKKNNGWYPGTNGSDVIDTRNAVLEINHGCLTRNKEPKESI